MERNEERISTIFAVLFIVIVAFMGAVAGWAYRNGQAMRETKTKSPEVISRLVQLGPPANLPVMVTLDPVAKTIELREIGGDFRCVIDIKAACLQAPAQRKF